MFVFRFRFPSFFVLLFFRFSVAEEERTTDGRTDKSKTAQSAQGTGKRATLKEEEEEKKEAAKNTGCSAVQCSTNEEEEEEEQDDEEQEEHEAKGKGQTQADRAGSTTIHLG
jgi:hypothetical protein